VEVCGVGGRVTLAGVRAHVRPAGETVEDSATAPEKPLMPATEMVEGVVLPATTVTLAGLAVRVKFVTTTVTVAVLDWPLFVPVTVIVWVPAEPVQDSVEVCGVGGRVTLAGVRAQVRPAGETADVRATVPANPFWPVTEIVEVAVLPWTNITLAGLALRAKLVAMTLALPELEP